MITFFFMYITGMGRSDLEREGRAIWEGILGETAKHEGHVRDGIETKCSRSFLKSTKYIQENIYIKLEPPNTAGNKNPN